MSSNSHSTLLVNRMSGPIFGLCPVDRDWHKESSGNPATGQDWIRSPPNAPKHLDDTDDVMRRVRYFCALISVTRMQYFSHFKCFGFATLARRQKDQCVFQCRSWLLLLELSYRSLRTTMVVHGRP